MTAKRDATLENMMAQVMGRKGGAASLAPAPDLPVPGALAPSTKPQEPGNPVSGTLTPPDSVLAAGVAQTRAAVAEHVAALRDLAERVTRLGTEVSELARTLEFTVYLVFPEDPTPAKPVDLEAQRKKALEAEADARWKRQQAEAQAAVFDVVKASEGENPWSKRDDDGWACPDHGEYKIKTSSKGRTFRVCPEPGCGEFERLKP